MTWLDTVIAVPVIGLKIEPEYRAAYTTAQLLAPLLDELQRANETVTFQYNAPWDFTARTSDGMIISVDPTDIVVRFAYPEEIIKRPGHLRTISPAKLRSYTELRELVRKLLRRVLDNLVLRDRPLSIVRFGIVAATTMESKQVPPGVESFIAHLGRPWGGVREYQGRLVAQIAKGEGFDDRCIHQLNVPDGTPGAILSLDYQRYFQTKPAFSTSAIAMTAIDEWCGVADAYFERFGAGEIDNASRTGDSAQAG